MDLATLGTALGGSLIQALVLRTTLRDWLRLIVSLVVSFVVTFATLFGLTLLALINGVSLAEVIAGHFWQNFTGVPIHSIPWCLAAALGVAAFSAGGAVLVVWQHSSLTKGSGVAVPVETFSPPGGIKTQEKP